MCDYVSRKKYICGMTVLENNRCRIHIKSKSFQKCARCDEWSHCSSGLCKVHDNIYRNKLQREKGRIPVDVNSQPLTLPNFVEII